MFPSPSRDWEAVGSYTDHVPLITLIGGVIGGAGGYFMQWYSAVIDYPFNLGGRPYHSWPAFIPVTFELTVLGAALFAVVGMLVLNGLPSSITPCSTCRNSSSPHAAASSCACVVMTRTMNLRAHSAFYRV